MPDTLTWDQVQTVRLLIPDTDTANQLLRDDQLQALADLEGGNLRLTAAQALDVIASSEVMVGKVIRSQDLATDGAKVSTELRARATSLREQAAAALDDADDDGGGFAVVDFDPYAAYR
jgi:hypothetical protein